jgi:translation initiation factor 2 gamma subunit (eIF-2gamma)
MAAMLNGAAIMDAALLIIGKQKILKEKKRFFIFNDFSC